MHKIFFAFILMIFSSTALSEEWRYLLSREDDGKAIEMDFHSVKADKNYIFLDIRYAPPSGWKSLLFDVAYHQEAIVVSCEKQSYAVATEIYILKDGSKKIKSSKPLPSLNYITPEDGSEPKRIIKTLCEKLSPQISIANQAPAPAPAQPQPKQVSPTLKVKSAIIENSPVDYNWRYLGEGVSDRQKLFINTPSIMRLGESVVVVLTKSEFPKIIKTPAGIEYKYSVIKELIDCKGLTVVMPWMDFYSDNDNLVETYYREFAELKEEKIPANSLLEMVAKTACPIGLAKESINDQTGSSEGKSTGKPAEESNITESSGTGWLISPSHLVTAYHVVHNATSIQVVVGEKDVIEASVTAIDPPNDIAILKLKKPLKSAPLALSTKQPRLGSRVAVLGYPLAFDLGLKIQATTGEISGLTGAKDDRRFYQFSAPAQQGNSGGPVLNQDGEVIGIVSSKLDDMEMLKKGGQIPQNVSFALKYPYVKALMESAGVVVKTPQKKSKTLEDAIHNAKDSVYLIYVLIQSKE